MLRINHQREVWYPIIVKLLREDGKGLDAVEFEIRYHLLTRKEQREKMREALDQTRTLNDASYRDQLAATMDAKKLEVYDTWLRSRVKDWRGIGDLDGQPIPFSDDALQSVMDSSTAIAQAIDAGLFNASRDQPAKN
jgi:hypothetical protein